MTRDQSKRERLGKDIVEKLREQWSALPDWELEWIARVALDAVWHELDERLYATAQETIRYKDQAITELTDEVQRLNGERIVSAVFAYREKDCPRPFSLRRRVDHTGVSGTGVVAYGAVFGDGTTVIRWCGEKPSTVVWANLDTAMEVHGHGGGTELIWLAEQFSDLAEIEERAERTEDAVKVASRMREALEEIKLLTVQRDLSRLATAALEGRPLPEEEEDHSSSDCTEADSWTVAVTVPMSLSVEMRHDLFAAISRTVGEWEPDDRDDWDADVTGYPTADAPGDETITVTRETLVDILARCRVDHVTPVNGEIKISADSMADAIFTAVRDGAS